MIGAPTDFRHDGGAEIGASGRREHVKGKFTFAYITSYIVTDDESRTFFDC